MGKWMNGYLEKLAANRKENLEAGGKDRRNVEHIGFGAVFRMQRQRHFPLVDELVNRAVLVIEKADEAQASWALTRTGRCDALLDTREAENAFGRFLRNEVEVDLLVGAGLIALAKALAFVFIENDDAVFFALVDRLGGAGLEARGIGAVIAQARQVEVVVVGVGT